MPKSDVSFLWFYDTFYNFYKFVWEDSKYGVLTDISEHLVTFATQCNGTTPEPPHEPTPADIDALQLANTWENIKLFSDPGGDTASFVTCMSNSITTWVKQENSAGRARFGRGVLLTLGICAGVAVVALAIYSIGRFIDSKKNSASSSSGRRRQSEGLFKGRDAKYAAINDNAGDFYQDEGSLEKGGLELHQVGSAAGVGYGTNPS